MLQELDRYRKAVERKVIRRGMTGMIGRVPDQRVDQLLGIQTDNLHTRNKIELIRRYGLTVFNPDQTDYKTVQETYAVVNPQSEDIVYDFGSGPGRVVIYGALTTNATFKGLELVEERVISSNRARERLGIANAVFIQTKVQDYDFSDGTIFYMFAPFLSGTMIEVREKLSLVAQSRPIQIATNCAHQHFEDQPWLETTYDNTRAVLGDFTVGLRVFSSKAA